MKESLQIVKLVPFPNRIVFLSTPLAAWRLLQYSTRRESACAGTLK